MKKKIEKAEGKELSQGNFLTVLCAGQKITEQGKEQMHSGTINIFNYYKGDEKKIIGLNLCKSQDRDTIFDSFGIDTPLCYKGVLFTLNRQQAQIKNGVPATYRVINFKSPVEKITSKV